MVRFAFDRLALHRVQAAVMPRNLGSIRVLEQAAVMPRNLGSIRVLEENGFRREGLAPRYLQIDGRWEDHLIFAGTAEDAGPPGAMMS